MILADFFALTVSHAAVFATVVVRLARRSVGREECCCSNPETNA